MTAVDTTAPGVRAGNPYVGPRSFVEGEKLYGRDREIDELRSTLLAATHRAAVLPLGGRKDLARPSRICGPSCRTKGFKFGRRHG